MMGNGNTGKRSILFRGLCLVMAGLSTGCSTARKPNMWHDLGAQPMAGTTSKVPEILENWGSKVDVSNDPDPLLAPGFLINVNCPADPKLVGDYRIAFGGDLLLAYGISLDTTGATLSQVRKKLIERLRAYLKDPTNVELRLKERRYWVDVRGLVEKPGRYLIEPESSLDMVIGLAGGTSKDSPPLYVRIQKERKLFIFDLNRYYSQGEEQPQILGWLGGEVLYFQKENFDGTSHASGSLYRLPISMTGEIRKPGDYTLLPGSDFVDTLTQAGGFTERADLDQIEIVRRSGGRKRAYTFAWKDFHRAPAPQQGDLIFVHASATTKGERRTSLVATVIGAMAAILTSTILILTYNRGGFGTR